MRYEGAESREGKETAICVNMLEGVGRIAVWVHLEPSFPAHLRDQGPLSAEC